MASQIPVSFPGFQPPKDLGAGISNKAKPTVPAQALKGEYSQASRALGLAAYFFSGSVAINASQVLGSPLSLVNKEWYNSWIAFTKQSWGLLTMTMTQWWAPTIVRVSGDSTMRGQLIQTTDGGLLCDFPERIFLIANHQIYTDWLYLWWIGYAAGMHGRIYVVLKESLKNIPVIGWGMQFAQFIFLKRKWEDDKPRLAAHMQRFNNKNPMWLMMFPEGTNLAPCTRETSRKWAAKNGIKDMQHTLLPRSTGLYFMLNELKDTVDFIYDCTIAYEGVPRGEYAQDIFTVGASYFGGRPPKSVNMYWRRFRVANIPLDDPKLFDIWLRARWTDKDKFIEHYYQTGRFPADTGSAKDYLGKTRAGAGFIEAEVKPKRWYEFLQVFAPIGLFSLVLYFFYGALPPDMVKKVMSIDHKTIIRQLDAIEKGQIKVPETKDIIATAPKHLQNRFDAVKKLAEARGTTPEKVIAQLQMKQNEVPQGLAAGSTRPAVQSGTVPPQASKKPSATRSPSKVKTISSTPASLSSTKAPSTTTQKTNLTPVTKSAAKGGPKKTAAASKAPASKAQQKATPIKSDQVAKSTPKPRMPASKPAALKKTAMKPKEKASKAPTRLAPHISEQKPEENEVDEKAEIRKARKKLELRQGKEESTRKIRRTVQSSAP